jgi:hypothetical protein
MKTLKLTLILFVLFSFSSLSYSQIGDLNKLGKKLEKKTERAVENAVDRNADKAINKTIKNAEDDITKPSDKTSKSKAGNKSDQQTTTVKPEESGNVIYVSKQNGSNKNDGSKSAPLKNLDKAIQIAESGTTIFITGGHRDGYTKCRFYRKWSHSIG